MEWISGWIQGIIIAVIIGTIIEMILPEGNCKKYIKVVIGVYILFSIVSPVITKVTGNDFKIANIFELDEYIEASTSNGHQDLNMGQEEQIRNIYENSLKNDMQEKIKAKGYEVIKISLEIENNEQYTLKNITLSLKKQIEKKQTTQNNKQNSVNRIQNVDKVQIQIENTNQNNKELENNSNKEEQLSSKEQKELKQYLSSTYQIEEKNININ